MFRSQALDKIPGSVRIVAAALLGAVGGLAATAAVMGFPFGIFGAIGGGVVMAIAAGIQVEHSRI